MCGYCVEPEALGTIFSKPYESLTTKDFNNIEFGKEAYLYPELIYTNEFGLPYLQENDPSSSLITWSLLNKSLHRHLSEAEIELHYDIWDSYQKNKINSKALTEISLMFPSVIKLMKDGPLGLFPENCEEPEFLSAKTDLAEQVAQFLACLVDTPSEEFTDLAEDDFPYKTLQLHPAFYDLTLEVLSLSCWLLMVEPNSPVFYKIINGYPDCPDFYCYFMPLQRYVAWEMYQNIGREVFISKSERIAPICLAYIAQHERADKLFVEDIYSLLLDSYKSMPFEGTDDAVRLVKQIIDTF